MSYMNIGDYPLGCRLSLAEFRELQRTVRPGDIFATDHKSLFSWFNQRYQERWGKGVHADHVGIVGHDGHVLESHLATGPVVGDALATLTAGKRRRLYVLRPKVTQEPSIRQIERALDWAERIAAQERGYDLLALVTFGRYQRNGSMICSEYVAYYLNELLRGYDGWELIADKTVLPNEIMRKCEIVWQG